jgi:hypothetical protein
VLALPPGGACGAYSQFTKRLYAGAMAEATHRRFPRKADLWQTIAGWIWVAYTAGLVVALVAIAA